MKSFINFFNKYKIYFSISLILSIVIVILLLASKKNTYFVENSITHFILKPEEQIIKIHPHIIDSEEIDETRNATIYNVINNRKRS